MGMVVPYLSLGVDELLDNITDLIEQQREQLGRHFLANQLFGVLLQLGSEFLVIANQQS